MWMLAPKNALLQLIPRNHNNASNLQNASPASPAFPSPSIFPLSSKPHSHSGYSLSSRASGVSLFFSNERPFSGVPAFKADTGGCGDDDDDLVDLVGEVGEVERYGEGVKGVEKGWAAEVEVAGDGARAVEYERRLSGSTGEEESTKRLNVWRWISRYRSLGLILADPIKYRSISIWQMTILFMDASRFPRIISRPMYRVSSYQYQILTSNLILRLCVKHPSTAQTRQ